MMPFHNIIIIKCKVIFYQVNYNCEHIPYFPATCWNYSNFKGGIPIQLSRKSLYSKHFRTLFPYIPVVGYPLYY